MNEILLVFIPFAQVRFGPKREQQKQEDFFLPLVTWFKFGPKAECFVCEMRGKKSFSFGGASHAR